MLLLASCCYIHNKGDFSHICLLTGYNSLSLTLIASNISFCENVLEKLFKLSLNNLGYSEMEALSVIKLFEITTKQYVRASNLSWKVFSVLEGFASNLDNL